MVKYLTWIFVGAILVTLLVNYGGCDTKPIATDITDSLAQANKNLQDSINLNLAKIDSLKEAIAINERQPLIIKKYYEKRISDIYTLPADGTVQLFTRNVHSQDSVW